jgi:hypothetical protein
MKSKPTNTGIDTLVGVSEVALDSILKDGVLKDIPLLGSAVGLARTFSSVRDLLFLRRIVAFIEGCKAGEEENLDIDLAQEKELKRAGETLLLVLESASSAFKAELFGRLFAALATEKVDVDFFERALESVGAANSRDLQTILQEEKVVEFDQRDHMRNLSNHGFTRPYGDDTFENIRSIYYELTDFGRTFLSAMGSPAPDSKPLGIRDSSAQPPDFAGELKSAVRTGRLEW